MNTASRVGLYIGAFDPIHSGHISFAKEAISSGALERVYFLIEPRPKSVQGVKAFDHRVNMAVIATKNIPNLGVAVIKGGTFSFDEVVPILTERFGAKNLNLLLAESMLPQIIKWPWLKMGDQGFNLLVGIKNLSPAEVRGQIQLLKDITGLKIKLGTFNLVGDSPHSQNIKAQLKRGNKPQKLPESVFNYIKEKRLYVSDNA